jgi:hypothetical protein
MPALAHDLRIVGDRVFDNALQIYVVRRIVFVGVKSWHVAQFKLEFRGPIK